MKPMSRSERAALCNTTLEAGPEAGTLCEGWDVKDLVIHLLVRERDPLGAPGIVVPQLEGLTALSSKRLRRQDFSCLVERVRQGPPRWSPMSIGPVDRNLNTLEYFVHHEDVRRAQPGWEPRELTEREQKILFKAVATAGRGLVRKVGVPVEIRWADRTATLRRGDDPAVVTGSPSELVMFLFGRDEVRDLAFDGPQEHVRALRREDKGL